MTKLLRASALALAAIVWATLPAHAQSMTRPARTVIDDCAHITYPGAGQPVIDYVDANGKDCRYSPTNPVPISGTVTGTVTGALSISPATFVSCTVLCANLVVDAAAGHPTSFEVGADSTLSAAAWWVMIYNATSAPADGAVQPKKCYPLPAGTTLLSASFVSPPTFNTGITIGVSTTGCYTKTESAHAFISGDFQ